MRWNTTDELFIDASPERVQRALLAVHEDHSWWPGARVRGGYGWVEMTVRAGRPFARSRFKATVGVAREWEGFPWTFESGDLRGAAEWWLEAFKNGTIVHYYLDVERGDRGRRMSAVVGRHRIAIRRGVNGLKDALESRGAARATTEH